MSLFRLTFPATIRPLWLELSANLLALSANSLQTSAPAQISCEWHNPILNNSLGLVIALATGARNAPACPCKRLPALTGLLALLSRPPLCTKDALCAKSAILPRITGKFDGTVRGNEEGAPWSVVCKVDVRPRR